jgi:hypothetical protein
MAIHKGPHPGILALLYTVLFCVGLYPVTGLYKLPYWPGPWESAAVIVPYFQAYGARVLFCLVLQLGAIICFGIFGATVVSRLQFLGARAAGTYIALLGGFLVVADAVVGAMTTWTMLRPGVVDHAPLRTCLLLPRLRTRWPRLLRAHGPVHGGRLGHRGFHEDTSQVGRRLRPPSRRGRRTQLAPPSLPKTPFSYPACPLPRFHLADCGWLPPPKDANPFLSHCGNRDAQPIHTSVRRDIRDREHLRH